MVTCIKYCQQKYIKPKGGIPFYQDVISYIFKMSFKSNLLIWTITQCFDTEYLDCLNSNPGSTTVSHITFGEVIAVCQNDPIKQGSSILFIKEYNVYKIFSKLYCIVLLIFAILLYESLMKWVKTTKVIIKKYHTRTHQFTTWTS